MDSRLYPQGSGGLKSRYVDGVLTFYNSAGATVYSIDPENRTVSVPSGSTLSSAGTTSVAAGAFTDDTTVLKTITSATPATERLFKGALTFTPATTFAVAAASSIAAVRGEFTITAGKSFTDGFLYGVSGKAIVSGTVAEVSAARVVGVIGQVDLGSGTLTAGQVSAIWADLQGNPTLTVNDQLFPLRVTNSMGGSKACQAFVFFHGIADFFMDINEPAPGILSSGAATPGGTMTKIKVLVGGDTLYLLAAATWS